jgi:transposase-like protein
MVDGIWFTVMEPTGQQSTDRKGRRRAVQRRVKRVAIIALGLWSESGRRQILDFAIADSEAEDSCLPLLNRLHLRGVTEAHLELIVSDGGGGLCAAIETVYPTVARQRCVFHKLRNVGENLCDHNHRKEMLRAAAWIYEAGSPQEAYERVEQFAASWQSREPEAVVSLLTDFDASIAYLGAVGLTDPRRYRTTNAVEGGVMRPLRRTLARATAFRSATGADIGVFLTVARLNAHRRKRPWVCEAKNLITKLYKRRP